MPGIAANDAMHRAARSSLPQPICRSTTSWAAAHKRQISRWVPLTQFCGGAIAQFHRMSGLRQPIVSTVCLHGVGQVVQYARSTPVGLPFASYSGSFGSAVALQPGGGEI